MIGSHSNSSSKCGYCHKTVDDDCDAIQCEMECDLWFHIKCVGIDIKEYNRLSNSDEEWACDKCALIKSNIMLKGEIQNLNGAMLALQADIQDLQSRYEEERRKNVNLSEICIKREEEIVKLSSRDPGTADQLTIRPRPWQLVSRSLQPNLNLSLPVRPSGRDLADYPPLPLKNRFTALETSLDNTSVISKSHSTPTRNSTRRGIGSYPKTSNADEESADRPSANPINKNATSRLRRVLTGSNRSHPNNLAASGTGPIKQQTWPKFSSQVKVHHYADSQGRGVNNEVKKGSNVPITSVVKPGAKFRDILPDCSNNLGVNDFLVVQAGSNDVSKNEAEDILVTLRRRLGSFYKTNVILFSIPHRHDLPEWSCVNELIKATNIKIKKVCRPFKNCQFIDVSNLGCRFHTAHGLHLNNLGKRFVGCKIIESLSSHYLNLKPSVPIALKQASSVDTPFLG